MDWLIHTLSQLSTETLGYASAAGAALLVLLKTQLGKELDKRLRKGLSKLLDSFAEHAPRYLAARRSDWLFQRRYHRRLLYHNRAFNTVGLRTPGVLVLELEKVFVELRIAPATGMQHLNRDLLARKELQGNHPIWTFLTLGRCNPRNAWRLNGCRVWEVFRHCRLWDKRPTEKLRLAIIGAPGCGKTTLLQHVVLTLAGGEQCRYGLEPYTPLFLALRQHVKAITGNQPPSLAKLAQTYFSNEDNYPGLNPPANWFARRLNKGRCLVLLDGLDEVADPTQRRVVSAWVDRQMGNYPDCAFLVTSRPLGYQNAPLQQANVLEVQPFTAAQVRRFVDNWYLATEITSFGGRLDAGVDERARLGAKDLLKRLHEHPRLIVLTVNPLLLTMVAMVHRYRGQLPGRRVELYGEICDVLLGHWQQAKGIQLKLTPAQNRAVLEPLAAHMMGKNIREISSADAAAVITEPLREVGVTVEDTAALQGYLRDVQAGSGLLLEGELDSWRFAHLTFQEYLCAAQLSKQPPHGNWWRARVADSWWLETLRLYAAQSDASPVVKACLSEGSVTALSLAADCLDEALKLAEPLRKQVEDTLIAGLEAEDPERRKLAAEVRLQRRLRNLQRIDENREIDLDYITCAEYQLFLDEIRTQNKYYQPNHWDTYTFPVGMAAEPVRGVRAECAAKFCEWLSGRLQENVEFGYRLPTWEEAQEHTGADGLRHLTAWCREKAEYRLANLAVIPAHKVLSDTLQVPDTLEWPPGLDLNFTCARNFARDLLFSRNHDVSITRDRVFSDAFSRDLNLDRSRNFNLLFELTHGFAPEIFAYDLAIGSGLDLFVSDSDPFNFDLDHVRSGCRDLAHDLALALNLENHDLSAQAQALIQNGPTLRQRRTGRLLYDLWVCSQAESNSEARHSLRQHDIDLTEMAWHGYGERKKLNLPWWQRLRRRKKYAAEERQAVLELHWYLRIVQARAEGKLPAWEGIRIVRERTGETDP